MSTERAASRTAPPTPHFIPLQHAIHIIAKQKPGCGSLEKMHKKLKSLRITTFQLLSLLLPPFCCPHLKTTLQSWKKKEITVHPFSLATVLRYWPSKNLEFVPDWSEIVCLEAPRMCQCIGPWQAFGEDIMNILAVDDRRSALIVLLLWDPHLLEGGEGCKDRSSNPDSYWKLVR